MNHLKNYSEEEWKTITYLPYAVGSLIGGAGNDKIFGSSSETMATTKAITAAKKKYPSNTLIHKIIKNPDEIKEYMENAKTQINHLMQVINSNNINTTEDLSIVVLNDCEKVLETLKTKENQQTISEYTSWLLDIALTVANTSKEGSFLGFGGERFSKEEQRIYKKLESVLK